MRLLQAVHVAVLSILGAMVVASPAMADAPTANSPLAYWTESPGGSWTLSPNTSQLFSPDMVVSPTAVGHNNGDQAVHAFTVDINGELWDSFSANPLAAPASWARTDVTSLTGAKVSTAVSLGALYLGGGTPSTQVFALSPAGHLLAFTTAGDGGSWQAFDLSALSGSHVRLTTAPHPLQFGSTVAVYATDSNKHLHDYYKPVTSNWQDVDITNQTSVHAIFGVPYAYGGNSIQIVSTSAATGHLLIFIQAINPDGTLIFGIPPSWFDITQLSGNTESPFGTATPVVAAGNTVNIFVDDVHHNVVDFIKTPTANWQVSTVATVDAPIQTQSAFWSASTGLHVITNNNLGHLADYSTTADRPPFTASPLPSAGTAFGDPSLVAVAGPSGPTLLTFSNY
jgi:hypothetical protein